MADKPDTGSAPDSTAAPARGARLATPVPTPARFPVSFWLGRKRPPEPMHDADRRARVHFDVLYAGAAAAGRWEPEFTLLTEDEFDQALLAVASLQFGGR